MKQVSGTTVAGYTLDISHRVRSHENSTTFSLLESVLEELSNMIKYTI